MHKALHCTCSQTPPPPPLFSISTILISCYATLPLLSFIPIIFCCNHFYCIFCLSLQFIVLLSHLLFSLSLFRTQYYVGHHVSSPCHLAYLYMVFHCVVCIVYSIQSPHKASLSSLLPLPLRPPFYRPPPLLCPPSLLRLHYAHLERTNLTLE